MPQEFTIPSMRNLEGQLSDLRQDVSQLLATCRKNADANPEDQEAAAREEFLESLQKSLTGWADQLEEVQPPEPPRDKPLRTYRGERHPNGRTEVTVTTWEGIKSKSLYLGPRQEDETRVRRSTYEWGTKGPRAQVLAQALLEDFTKDPEYARERAEDFTTEVTAKLPITRWTICNDQIVAWIEDHPTLSKAAADIPLVA